MRKHVDWKSASSRVRDAETRRLANLPTLIPDRKRREVAVRRLMELAR